MDTPRDQQGPLAALLLQVAAAEHQLRELRGERAVLLAEIARLRGALEESASSRTVQAVQRLQRLVRRAGLDPRRLADLVFGRR